MFPQKLERAIENLYSVFSKYELNSKIIGCPCCVSDSDKDKIHSKELRDLQEEDLTRYALKAMTTFGNVNDFKHFLPRILELLVDDHLGVSIVVIFGKLDYGHWKTWEPDEQEAIEIFLFEWWEYYLKKMTYFDNDLFYGIYKLTKDIDQLLQLWNVNITENSFIIYVDFIQNHYQDFINEKDRSKDFDEKDYDKFLKWSKENVKNLEIGFYLYENENQRFAREISDALYVFEHS
ncbi:hypothetical protein SAMN05443633_101164 [Chryseobacterium arachidis]|uniref:Uncharacterized protein n=1 Tax=Chryseobacterium arachidis TaxID=1416778 RepID=A0A1M4T6H0_9FLAO|nr:hypothetical protein [Chryseobacterium arachidis]SHE39918.1 hypothetical protein SAMN05443633_101164 [Chryseobacterium arachidis]